VSPDPTKAYSVEPLKVTTSPDLTHVAVSVGSERAKLPLALKTQLSLPRHLNTSL